MDAGLMSRARGLGYRQQRLAADRLGGQAGRFHVDFSRGEAVELRPQPSFTPQRELPPEIVFLLEKDRRPCGAKRLFEAAACRSARRECVQPLQMTQQCANYRDRRLSLL